MPTCSESNKNDGEFYGTTTLGERGQVVIPAKARKKFKLEKGEELLVFGMGKNMITLVKLEKAKEFASQLARKLKSINSIIEKTADQS
jgi:AbrB family looped-hinge helix DNA binding protein